MDTHTSEPKPTGNPQMKKSRLQEDPASTRGITQKIKPPQIIDSLSHGECNINSDNFPFFRDDNNLSAAAWPAHRQVCRHKYLLQIKIISTMPKIHVSSKIYVMYPVKNKTH